MLLAEDGHSFYIRSAEVRREKLRFFDQWVGGIRRTAVNDKPITVWFSERGSIEKLPGHVGQYDKLPPDGKRWTRLFLNQKRILSAAQPSAEASLSYLYPLGSAFVYGGSGYPHVPFRTGSLIFRSEPIPAEITLLGPISARLFLSTEQPDTSLMLVLNEITEAGERKYLQRGYLLASLRGTDAKASRDAQPVYPFLKRVPLKPGAVHPLDIELNWTGSVLRKRSVLELIVMAPEMSPEPWGQWAFMPREMGRNTIHLSPRYPSSILLPVLEGQFR